MDERDRRLLEERVARLEEAVASLRASFAPPNPHREPVKPANGLVGRRMLALAVLSLPALPLALALAVHLATARPGWAIETALFATVSALLMGATAAFRLGIFQRLDVERHWAHLVLTGLLATALAMANAVLVLSAR
jgi:hypothetical protein